MAHRQKTILWWGRFDPDYSRNGLLRRLLVELGYRLIDFRPRISFLGGIEAKFADLSGIDAVWVPAFRQRDFQAARHFAERHRLPLIFDPLISAWDKEVFERGKFPRSSSAARRLQRREQGMFSKADLVLADTVAHAEFYIEELAARRDCTKVVQVGADETLFRFQELPIAGSAPEILFYGSFLGLQGPEVIVEAARTMPEVRWTLLGNGPLRPKCLERSGGMAHIRFEDWLPYEELPQRIGRASILLGIFGSSAKAGRVIANKVFQALACGRPLITRDSGAFPTALRTDPACGISFIPAGDPIALAAAVRELLDKPDLLPVRGQQARASYEAWFSEAGIRKALVDGLRHIGL
jgi:glycosyltransferase involved in cell wall biosynthesis